MRLSVLVLVLAAMVAGCPLDPTKVPPCSGREIYPDPCAAASRDAGPG